MSEIKTLAANPQIEQIRLGSKVYDIKTTKDWEENDTETIGYIANRTHHFYDITAKQLKSSTELQNQLIIDHVFQNRYSSSGDQLYRDIWYPGVSWLEVGKVYDIQVELTHSDTDPICITKKLELGYTVDPGTEEQVLVTTTVYISSSDHPDLASTNIKVSYSSVDKAFWVEGEDYAVNETGFNVSNGFTLRIKPSIEVADEETYKLTKQLDAHFLPLDNSSIRMNAAGQLEVDDVFPTDFRVSYTFGQYNPSSRDDHTVQAAGKTVKDVILDAFCRDVNPLNNTYPKITDFTISPQTPTDENGYYEVGETITCDWAVTFDPGKYEFGVTTQGKSFQTQAASDIVIESHSGSISKGSIVTADGTSIKAFGAETQAQFTCPDPYNPYEGTFTSGNNTGFGWGVGNSAVINSALDENSTFDYQLPTDPVHEAIPATYKVIFDHVDLKGVEDDRDQIIPEYVPCTMFGIPIQTSQIGTVCFHNKVKDRTCTATIETFKCNYRWFWGAVDKDHTANWLPEDEFENLTTVARDDLLAQNSQLGSFPDSFKTFKMQKLYFLAPACPEGQTATLNIQAADGSNPKIKAKCDVNVADPSGVTHKYDLWIFENATPDLAVHTYKINYEKGAS